jgi:hypothetical protein
MSTTRKRLEDVEMFKEYCQSYEPQVSSTPHPYPVLILIPSMKSSALSSKSCTRLLLDPGRLSRAPVGRSSGPLTVFPDLHN